MDCYYNIQTYTTIFCRFDMKLCRDQLIEQLFKNEQTKPTACIKRNGAYTLLSTEKLVFKDFAQLLPPGK